MKISKLIETPIRTTVTDKTAKGSLKKFNRDPGTNPAGAFSTVVADRDPHLIRKYSKTRLSEDDVDGFRLFIQYLIDSNEMHNPHLPKVYEVKTVRDGKGYRVESYRIEKLLDSKNVEENLLKAYVDEITGVDTDGMEHRQRHNFLSNRISDAIEGYSSKLFTQQPIEDACRIISDAINDLSAHYVDVVNDVHQANVMYRRTPQGIQVVINDPIHIITY